MKSPLRVLVLFIAIFSGSAQAGGGPTLGYLSDMAIDVVVTPFGMTQATTHRMNGRYKEVLPVIEADVALFRIDGSVSNLLRKVVEDIAESEGVKAEDVLQAIRHR